MGRLKQLPSRLSALPPRLASGAPMTEAGRSQHRDASHHWRKRYKTARWQKLRWSVLMRDLFTCRRCRRIEANTSQLVADHVSPHRGNEVMFWDAGNLQCLCKPCHDRDKQAEERAGRW
jgi:5-methylcytosine-specific restriction protein A